MTRWESRITILLPDCRSEIACTTQYCATYTCFALLTKKSDWFWLYWCELLHLLTMASVRTRKLLWIVRFLSCCGLLFLGNIQVPILQAPEVLILTCSPQQVELCLLHIYINVPPGRSHLHHPHSCPVRPSSVEASIILLNCTDADLRINLPSSLPIIRNQHYSLWLHLYLLLPSERCSWMEDFLYTLIYPHEPLEMCWKSSVVVRKWN